MKSTLYISGLLLFFILGFAASECTRKPIPEMPEAPQEAKKDSLKADIIEKEVEVIKWKAQKDRIVYDTIFDTLATKETIYVELIKCDSVVKISDSIIASQDTIIADQKELITIVESNNSVLKKDLKKQKRKNTIIKIGSGIAIVLTFLLAH